MSTAFGLILLRRLEHLKNEKINNLLISTFPVNIQDAVKYVQKINQERGDEGLAFLTKYMSLPVVLSLEKYGADLTAKDYSGGTAMFMAAYSGHINVMEYFLSRGLSIDYVGRWGFTAMHWAAAGGHLEAFKWLHSRNGDILAVDYSKRTPLHIAASRGNLSIIKYYLSQNIEMNSVKEKYGNSVLHMACIGGHINHLYRQIQHDYLIAESFDHHVNGLEYPNNFNVVEYLLSLKTININIRNNASFTPLSFAAMLNYTDILELLLNHNVDVNSLDNYNNNALHLAAHKGNLHIVKLLLSSNIDANVQNNDGSTALHWAVRNNHLNVVQLLVEKKVNVNLYDGKGWCKWYYGNYINIQNIENRRSCYPLTHYPILYEISACSILDRSVMKGNTSLHVAVNNGNLDIATYLVKKGKANLDIQNKDYNTPLNIAINERRLDMVKLLLENNASVNTLDSNLQTPLLRALYAGDTEILDLIMTYNSNINMQDQNGNTQLHHVMHTRNITTIKWLLEKYQANVNIQNNVGETILHCAACSGSTDINYIYLLMDHSNNLEIKNNEGLTPVQVAKKCGETFIADLLEDRIHNNKEHAVDGKSHRFWRTCEKLRTRF